MSEQGGLLYGDEASRFIDPIGDPVTSPAIPNSFVTGRGHAGRFTLSRRSDSISLRNPEGEE